MAVPSCRARLSGDFPSIRSLLSRQGSQSDPLGWRPAQLLDSTNDPSSGAAPFLAPQAPPGYSQAGVSEPAILAANAASRRRRTGYRRVSVCAAEGAEELHSHEEECGAQQANKGLPPGVRDGPRSGAPAPSNPAPLGLPLSWSFGASPQRDRQRARFAAQEDADDITYEAPRVGGARGRELGPSSSSGLRRGSNGGDGGGAFQLVFSALAQAVGTDGSKKRPTCQGYGLSRSGAHAVRRRRRARSGGDGGGWSATVAFFRSSLYKLHHGDTTDDDDEVEEPKPVLRSVDSRIVHRARLGLDGQRPHKFIQQAAAAFVTPRSTGGGAVPPSRGSGDVWDPHAHHGLDAAMEAAGLAFNAATVSASATGAQWAWSPSVRLPRRNPPPASKPSAEDLSAESVFQMRSVTTRGSARPTACPVAESACAGKGSGSRAGGGNGGSARRCASSMLFMTLAPQQSHRRRLVSAPQMTDAGAQQPEDPLSVVEVDDEMPVGSAGCAERHAEDGSAGDGAGVCGDWDRGGGEGGCCGECVPAVAEVDEGSGSAGQGSRRALLGRWRSFRRRPPAPLALALPLLVVEELMPCEPSDGDCNAGDAAGDGTGGGGVEVQGACSGSACAPLAAGAGAFDGGAGRGLRPSRGQPAVRRWRSFRKRPPSELSSVAPARAM